jgi:hypothetical protein
MSGDGYNGDAFRDVWRSLSKRTQDRIRGKAEWEHMSVSAVMRDWWPHLWSKVKNASARKAGGAA